MTKSWPGRSATRPWCDWPCRVLKHCTSNTRSGAAECIPTVRCKPSRGGPRNSGRLTPTVCASRFRSEGLRVHVGEGKEEGDFSGLPCEKSQVGSCNCFFEATRACMSHGQSREETSATYTRLRTSRLTSDVCGSSFAALGVMWP